MGARNYRTLDPRLVLEILNGVKSGMDGIQESNQKSQNAVLGQNCPHCNGGLVPRLPKEADKVVGKDGGLRYEGWCTACRTTIAE